MQNPLFCSERHVQYYETTSQIKEVSQKYRTAYIKEAELEADPSLNAKALYITLKELQQKHAQLEQSELPILVSAPNISKLGRRPKDPTCWYEFIYYIPELNILQSDFFSDPAQFKLRPGTLDLSKSRRSNGKNVAEIVADIQKGINWQFSHNQIDSFRDLRKRLRKRFNHS